MTDVRVVEIPDSEMVRLSFRYDRDVIDIVKEASRGLRHYDGETKSWMVNESVVEQVIDAITAAGHQVIAGEAPKPIEVELEGFFGTDNDRAYVAAMAETIVKILDQVPEKSRHRVFRAVAKSLYPDLYARP